MRHMRHCRKCHRFFVRPCSHGIINRLVVVAEYCRIDYANDATKRSFSVYSMSLMLQIKATSCVSMVLHSY